MFLLLLGLGSCTRAPQPVVLASTTSTEDSGLFDVLLPAFQEAHPQFVVRLIAVGSGQALELGARGDADVLLVHSPVAEEAFMRNGHGATRDPVMYNDFVLVGTAADPAAARGLPLNEALRAIAATRSNFISRGDESGTHRKEQGLWSQAGISPTGADWYREVGQGMGETLVIAAERGAYTLADRGTYLSFAPRVALDIIVEGDSALFNPYSVIVATRARNARGARTFATWLTSPAAQRMIGTFGVEAFGRPLFTPSGR